LSFLFLSIYALLLTCGRIGSHWREWYMKELTTNPDAEGFEREAEKYAAYLKTPAGRLRLAQNSMQAKGLGDPGFPRFAFGDHTGSSKC
jgi:hypothetical protein